MGYIARQWQNKLDYKKSTILLFAFFMISYIEFTALRKGLHIESLSAFTISTFPLAIFTLLTFAHYEKFIKNNLHLQMGGGGNRREMLHRYLFVASYHRKFNNNLFSYV